MGILYIIKIVIYLKNIVKFNDPKLLSYLKEYINFVMNFSNFVTYF